MNSYSHLSIEDFEPWFSAVEFKGMGQFGHNNYDDLRNQILFYNIKNERQSYVVGCAFVSGFHTAVAALFNSNDIRIERNAVFGCVNSAIRTDGNGIQIRDNIVGNVYQFQLWQNNVEQTENTNFADDKMPAGIDTRGAKDPSLTIAGNTVIGVDGPCFAGAGQRCESSESCSAASTHTTWTNNVGSGCLSGYLMLWSGQGECTKVTGFVFDKMAHYGVTLQSPTAHLVIDNLRIHNSVVGIYGILYGPDAAKHQKTLKPEIKSFLFSINKNNCCYFFQYSILIISYKNYQTEKF